MNIIIRRFLAFFLSFSLVFVSVTSANSASPAGWVVTKAISSGARVIVNATNSGYKSAVNIAPNVGRLALTLGKTANTLSLLYAVGSLALDGVDFVMDPANNQVKYKVSSPSTGIGYTYGSGDTVYPSAEQACQNLFSKYPDGTEPVVYFDNGQTLGQQFRCKIRSGGIKNAYGRIVASDLPIIEDRVLPFQSVADNLVNKAINGDSRSKDILKNAAIESVNSGAYDADLMSGAIPVSDNKPVIPAVPGSQTGDIDTGMGGGDVGAAADGAKAAKDAAKKASDAAKNAYQDAANDARAANDAAKDLISQSVDQAIKDLASVAAKDAAEAAKQAKDVADAAELRYKDAAKEAAKAAEKVAEKALEDFKDIAEKALEDVKEQALEDVKTAEKALEKAKEAVEEAAKELEKAKEELAEPFELPAFCGWASPVCDAIDWLTKPAPDLDDDTELDINVPDVVAADTDINFGGSCPANFEVHSTIFGNSIDIVLFDTSKFCTFLSTFVKFPVYAASSLVALYILGGRKDG